MIPVTVTVTVTVTSVVGVRRGIGVHQHGVTVFVVSSHTANIYPYGVLMASRQWMPQLPLVGARRAASARRGETNRSQFVPPAVQR
jgi:uncharacterized protein YigE (DUF2233 family)